MMPKLSLSYGESLKRGEGLTNEVHSEVSGHTAHGIKASEVQLHQ